ncbi:unnamed protein product [Echinostoma caproni]|uniref:Uncharacterized protein n=1 Tax=Echinostoma caproni TaxID=27848 RepID=A0A183AST0_9TREM|nr:unnamed protein product [Echinostoma caproni]
MFPSTVVTVLLKPANPAAHGLRPYPQQESAQSTILDFQIRMCCKNPLPQVTPLDDSGISFKGQEDLVATLSVPISGGSTSHDFGISYHSTTPLIKQMRCQGVSTLKDQSPKKASLLL